MKRAIGVPFARPGTTLVAADPWMLHTEGSVEELPASLPHWDYHTDLVLTRSIAVDAGTVRNESQLEGHAPLRVAAFWDAQGTALRGKIDSADVPQEGDVHVKLSGRLEGETLCGIVTLETKLITATCQKPAPLRPLRAGSILWADQVSVCLEGTGSRFPVAVTDFSTMLGHPDDAGWLLSWNPLDLHQPFMGSVQLLLNQRHSRVVEAVSAQSSPVSTAIRSAVYYDVARSLIRGALENDEFVADPSSFGPGSVGRAVRSLIARVFPGESAAGVRSAMREQPEYFDSVLQSKLRLFME